MIQIDTTAVQLSSDTVVAIPDDSLLKLISLNLIISVNSLSGRVSKSAEHEGHLSILAKVGFYKSDGDWGCYIFAPIIKLGSCSSLLKCRNSTLKVWIQRQKEQSLHYNPNEPPPPPITFKAGRFSLSSIPNWRFVPSFNFQKVVWGQSGLKKNNGIEL